MKRSELKRTTKLAPKCTCGHGYARHTLHAGRNDFRCDKCGPDECPRYRPKVLQRGTKALKRGGKLKSRKADPTKRRFAKLRNDAYRQWVKEQPCFLMTLAHPKHPICHGFWSESRPGIECMHVKTRGSGGADEANCLPACPAAHDEQEGKTRAFESKYGVNLKTLAYVYWTQYEKEILGRAI